MQELVDSIKSMLRSDEEHMEEAVRCASIIDQVSHRRARRRGRMLLSCHVTVCLCAPLCMRGINCVDVNLTYVDVGQ